MHFTGQRGRVWGFQLVKLHNLRILCSWNDAFDGGRFVSIVFHTQLAPQGPPHHPHHPHHPHNKHYRSSDRSSCCKSLMRLLGSCQSMVTDLDFAVYFCRTSMNILKAWIWLRPWDVDMLHPVFKWLEKNLPVGKSTPPDLCKWGCSQEVHRVVQYCWDMSSGVCCHVPVTETLIPSTYDHRPWGWCSHIRDGHTINSAWTSLDPIIWLNPPTY